MSHNKCESQLHHNSPIFVGMHLWASFVAFYRRSVSLVPIDDSPLIVSLINSFACSLVYSLAHSLTHSFVLGTVILHQRCVLCMNAQ